MMFKRISLALFLSIFCAYSYGYEALEAVCKVHAGNSRGSGTCVDIYQDVAFIFTNYHVAGRTGSSVSCQFYKEGHESIKVSGKVVWSAFQRNGNVDQAIIALDINQMGNYRPKVIPFGDPNTQLAGGDTIVTVGCPEAKWPALCKGHIIRNSNGVYYIKPPVENGRSGSALIDDKTKTIIGIITWRSGDNYDGIGMAQDLQTIYHAMGNLTQSFKYNVSDDMMWTEYDNKRIFWPATKWNHLPEPENEKFYVEIQCPGGGCQPYGFGLNPRPYRESEPPGYNGNPYPNGGRLFPTLPQNPDPQNPGPTFPNQPQDFESLLNEKLAPLQGSVDSLAEGLNDLDGKVGQLDIKIDSLGNKVINIEGRVKSLEDRLVVTPGQLEEELDKRDYITPGKVQEYTEVYNAKINELNIKTEENSQTIQKVQNDVIGVAGVVDVLSEPQPEPEIEEAGLETQDWYSLLFNGLGILLGGGSVGGLLAWGLNLLGKRIGEGLGGSGGPQSPFPVSQTQK